MDPTVAGIPVQVAGCDVAKGWWVAVVTVDGRVERAVRKRSFEEVVEACPAVTTFVVDIPIGIPTDGRRAADEEARLAVGARRNSVFSTPVRAALQASSHAAAVEANRAATGSGVSQQAWALRSMIFDVEELAEADPRVYEGHPEVSFAQMAGEELADPKTTWNGMQRRVALLREHGLDVPGELAEGVWPDRMTWLTRRRSRGPLHASRLEPRGSSAPRPGAPLASISRRVGLHRPSGQGSDAMT